MTTYDIHAHCIPSSLLDLLRSDGPRLGLELRDDGKGEYAIVRDRVRLQPFNPVRERFSDAHISRRSMPTDYDVQLLCRLDRPHCICARR